MTEYKASKVYEMGSRTDVPYWLVQAKDGRAVVGLETEREADAVVESLNTETAKLQAELDAAKAEIARLRNDVSGVLITMSTTAAYQDNEEIEDLLVFFAEKIRKQLNPSATDVTLNDDTQKLPVLVKCVLCEGAGFIERRQNFRDLLEVTKTCPDCHGTGKVEQLPFDGSPEHTPKFKVGDKVKSRLDNYAEGYFDIIASVEWNSDENQFGYKLLYNGKKLGMIDWFDDELEHVD